jgi:chloride channel protein, CIC family
VEELFTLRKEQHNGFIEFRLLGGEKVIGVRLMDLDLSHNVSVVSVERNGVLIIPQGDTCFAVGDVVTIFARREDLDKARQEFTARKDQE